ncbi:MAG: bifunctional riboflavin kinase/FAD synthetase [Ruminococcaceae bacterium]|nr:bifunctional riboflavin kinase/FAD synthetase [Oscillospiraceae bacterium]
MQKKTIYALGFFDGVHLGHQVLLRQCRRLADGQGCDAGVVTFTTHPDNLVTGKIPALLNTAVDRRFLLHAYGMDRVKELPFDKELMQTHWSVFLEDLVKDGAAGFVCGSDFRFGAEGNGTAKKLEAFCEKRTLSCVVVPQQELDGVRVSSTYIRELIEQGEMEKATAFLGHPHILSGEVVHGRGLGHTIGIPTANLQIPEGVICPKFGVYACKTVIEGKEYLAVTNVGMRPTVNGSHITVETLLLDFVGDLYGKRLYLQFYKFLRPERKFASLEELKAEIQKNAEQVRLFFQ